MNMIHFKLKNVNHNLFGSKTVPKSEYFGLKLRLSTTEDDENTRIIAGLLLIRDRSLSMYT